MKAHKKSSSNFPLKERNNRTKLFLSMSHKSEVKDCSVRKIALYYMLMNPTKERNKIICDVLLKFGIECSNKEVRLIPVLKMFIFPIRWKNPSV